MATRKRSIYATTSYFHGTDLYDNVQDPLKWIEVMWRQENNPEVVMSPVWKKLPWDLQVMVIEELYEVSAQRCYQIWDCLHDGTLDRNGLFHPNSFYMPFNVLLACGGQWQRYTYVKLIRKDPGLITNAKIAFRALESFSRFYPSPILGLQEIRLEVNVFGGANRDDNSQDIICILQHLSLMENLKSLRFWFHTYEGIKDFLRLPDKMPYNDSFLDVFAALTEVYVKKAEITGLKCEETTRELKDLMMGKTVWDETRSLDVWAQNDAWYMAQEIQQNQQNQENQGNQDMDPWW